MIETLGFSFLFLSGMRIFSEPQVQPARNQATRRIIIDCASGINEQHHRTPTLRSFAFFGGFFEMNNFSRVTGAFLLAVSLLGSSTISLAQTTTVINPSQDQKTTTSPTPAQ